MSVTWRGLDPTAIVGRVLEKLVAMLDLDFAGLRFHDAAHVFLRIGTVIAHTHDADYVRRAVEHWLPSAASGGGELRLGDDVLSVACVEMGDLSRMGELVIGARRANFPKPDELLRLKVAAMQTHLACCQVRELNGRVPSADTRHDKPTGEALAENEWRLNLAINTIPAMAWSATPDGRLDFCNQRLLDFVGLPASEILGFGFYRIFHPDDLAHMLATWQAVLASGSGRDVEGRIRRSDGEYRWFALRQSPLLDQNGAVVKWYGVILDIEDRRQTEKALEEARSALLASEQNLRLIVDSLPVLAWVASPDGSAEFVNARWAEYAGVGAEQIVDWGFLRFYHPEDVDEMVRIWQDCRENRDVMHLKGRIRKFDGEYRRFYFYGRKITDAHGADRWVGANVDIEDLQRAEDALKASEQKLKLIIDTIPAMSWSAAPDGRVDFFSKSLLEYCGLQFEDVVGSGYHRMFHPDDLEPMLRVWDRVCVGQSAEEVDGRVLRADGQYRWFTLRQSPLLDAEGRVSKWYGALVDIEDRKRAEEELRQSQSELARVSRVTTLGELAVSIAHEINQPLMAIVTNAGTCLRWLDDRQFDAGRARQAAERVVSDGHRAGEIVASIRALASKSPVRMARMDLHDAIRDVLQTLAGELRRSRVDAVFRSSRPAWVHGDRTQLQQVLLNLIMNSVEAMAVIDPTARRLTISTTADESGLTLVRVLDSGPGVAPHHMARVFEAFFTTKRGGIGIGLAICRSIVEAHGGSIGLSTHASGDCMFTFSVRTTPDGAHR